LEFADIERVEFFIREGAGTLVSMPFTEGAVPQISAQFCAPYAIALALCKGEVNIRDFSNEAVSLDRDTIDLAIRTVECSRFSDMKLKKYPKAQEYYRYIKVYLRNNEILEHGYSNIIFCDPDAMDMPRVENKLRQCMAVYDKIPPGKDDKIIKTVKSVKEMKNVSKLINIL
jgi:2-methylcitrate dehydratase PrpD